MLNLSSTCVFAWLHFFVLRVLAPTSTFIRAKTYKDINERTALYVRLLTSAYNNMIAHMIGLFGLQQIFQSLSHAQTRTSSPR